MQSITTDKSPQSSQSTPGNEQKSCASEPRAGLSVCPLCAKNVMSVDLSDNDTKLSLTCLMCNYAVNIPTRFLPGFDISAWKDIERRDQMFEHLEPLFQLWNATALLIETKKDGFNPYILGYMAGVGGIYKPDCAHHQNDDRGLAWLDGWVDGSFYKDQLEG